MCSTAADVSGGMRTGSSRRAGTPSTFCAADLVPVVLAAVERRQVVLPHLAEVVDVGRAHDRGRGRRRRGSASRPGAATRRATCAEWPRRSARAFSSRLTSTLSSSRNDGAPAAVPAGRTRRGRHRREARCRDGGGAGAAAPASAAAAAPGSPRSRRRRRSRECARSVGAAGAGRFSSSSLRTRSPRETRRRATAGRVVLEHEVPSSIRACCETACAPGDRGGRTRAMSPAYAFAMSALTAAGPRQHRP